MKCALCGAKAGGGAFCMRCDGLWVRSPEFRRLNMTAVNAPAMLTTALADFVRRALAEGLVELAEVR